MGHRLRRSHPRGLVGPFRNYPKFREFPGVAPPARVEPSTRAVDGPCWAHDKQVFDLVFFALGHDLHPAVGAILDPAGQPQIAWPRAG